MSYKFGLRLYFCVIAITWISLAAASAGEVVVLLSYSQLPGDQCLFPRHYDVTILRQRHDDVTLSLTTNDILTMPNQAVVMAADEHTGVTSYQTVQVSEQSKAYHNIDSQAAFVMTFQINKRTSKQDEHSNDRLIVLEGTFFHEGSKFKLLPSKEDKLNSKRESYVIVTYTIEEVIEFNHPNDHGYIESPEFQSMPDDQREIIHKESRQREASHHRSKRATTDYFIDILPVIDYSLYQSWLSLKGNDVTATTTAITTYMTNVLTSMSLRLATLSLRNDVVLNLKMINPHLSTSASTSPYSENIKEPQGDGRYKISVSQLLEGFKDWVGNNTGTLPSHDHAMLFTEYDVYGGIDGEVGSNLTRGLAYIATMCKTDGFSSSVVQDQKAYQSEPVAVHELGHSLGSVHDGQDNACASTDRYIMANGSYPEDQANLLHPFSFSSCSSDSISTKIEQLAVTSDLTTCLTATTGTSLPEIEPITASEQCQSLFGPLSYVCRGSNFPDIKDVCTSLYCDIPNSGYCRKLTAATGTCCGNGKYCKGGVCQAAPSGQCQMDEVCPFSDQPSGIIEGKTCEEIHPSYCYQNVFYERCCHRCQKNKTAEAGCEFGDKNPQCQRQDCDSTLSTGIKYNFICCGTCSLTGCTDRTGFAFQGDTYTCPEFIAKFGKNYCYFPTVHTSMCCKTCEAERTANENCPYGDYLHRFNCPKIEPLNRACVGENEHSLCCATCPTLADRPTPGQPQTETPSITTSTTTPRNVCEGLLCDGSNATSVSIATIVMSVLLTLLLEFL